MNETLYQIGLPIENLSNVLLNWTCYEPRLKMLISPSTKNEGWAVIETRHLEFAAVIVKDVPMAKLKEVEQRIKNVTL